ncbi:MAG TPA: triose-phosphate isomerase, partial [Candidatus Limnocylindria bacterium]|nr:triose-phosphate isomerase [Candidatus Limnocylindria bacterium]
MAGGRVPLVAGNWKMNPTSRAEAIMLARDVAEATRGLPVRTVICPPDVFLEAVAAAVGETTTAPGGLGIGAQTMQAAESGAF